MSLCRQSDAPSSAVLEVSLTARQEKAIIRLVTLNFMKGYLIMARKKTPQRRDWRMIAFLAISIVIVLSMVLFTVLPTLPGN